MSELSTGGLPLMKPCPFCGCKVDVDDLDAVYPVNRERTLWQAGHYTCSASVLGETLLEAIANWNKRSELKNGYF